MFRESRVCISLLYTIISSLFWSCESQPPPPSEPTTPIYSVISKSDICLLVQMDLKLKVYFFTTANQLVSSDVYLNQTTKDNVTVSGSCLEDLQSIKLEWTPIGAVDPWFVGLQFRRLSTEHFSMDILELNFTTSGSQFPFVNETKPRYMIRNASQFTCPLGSYFQCLSQQTSKLVNPPFVPTSDTQLDVFVTLSEFKAEAFRSGPNATFVSTKTECFADYVPNKVVPIVIGVALAGMIIIALATFIIGSRRRQRGYREI